MLIDSRSVPENKVIETDVCIIGAGAAGITLAREMINRPFRVCLLESGGLAHDRDTQSLYQGEVTGVPFVPLHFGRLRYFGGTTNHWEGWCRPLDALDFETREWVPYSGWPFAKADLVPFYQRAQSTCQLGPFTYDIKDWESDRFVCLPFGGDRVITTIFQHSPPTNFGAVYRDEIIRARNISTYLNANAVDIETTQNARSVSRLRVACLQGPNFWIPAKLYILAAGGIENARLLLLSRKTQSTGLGNQNDLVGRFFMEHPHLESGVFLPSDLSGSLASYALYADHVDRTKKPKATAVLSLSSETLRREKLLNFSALLRPRSQLEISRGVASLRVLYRAIRRGKLPDDFVRHLGNVVAEFEDVASVAARRVSRGEEGLFPFELFSLFNRTEQAPNPDSRVTLIQQRDALALNRVQLNWQLSPMDKRSIRRAHQILSQELGRAGLGRLRIDLDDVDDRTWPPDFKGGFHHMGTTRMHVDPKRGVVDQNCQVHGISNLFIAGSSVFPTSGYANPTLTIVALALRLADHVRGIMR